MFALSDDGKWVSYLAPYKSLMNLFVRPADAAPADGTTRDTWDDTNPGGTTSYGAFVDVTALVRAGGAACLRARARAERRDARKFQIDWPALEDALPVRTTATTTVAAQRGDTIAAAFSFLDAMRGGRARSTCARRSRRWSPNRSGSRC